MNVTATLSIVGRIPLLGVLLFAGAGIAAAHDQIPGAPQTQPILVRDATVHTVDGETLERGSILFTDGRITAIGAEVEAPETARVIEGTGHHVYPGLVDSMTDLGLREITAVDVTVDHAELGMRNPNARSWVAVNPDSELIPVARAGGVLVANVAPGGRFVRGQSAVMQLDGWTAAEMVLEAPSGMTVAWESLQPNDSDAAAEAKKREEKLRELDEWLAQAKRYGDARARGEIDVATDLRLEAMLPVIRGELPMIVEADRQSTIESAVAYAVKHSLRLVIYGGYDAAECATLLKSHDIPVLIAGTYRLPRRRHDAYDAPYTLPERLRQHGVRFAICGEGPGYPGGASNVRNLPYHAAVAVAYGLPRDQAVRSITLSAAEILGVNDRIGSLTVGKHATLIVTDGDVLETETQVTAAFIQGRAVDLSNKHTMLFEKYQRKYQAEP